MNPPPLTRAGLPPVGGGLLLLWLAALMLALAGLGHAPLRDWDEGIVARVSLEIAQRGLPDGLFPTFWGRDYLNKPPGLHLLIAATIDLWRRISQAPAGALPPEWVVRLAPAFLSTLVVPLVGLLQWQLRPGDRLSALASAGLVLTLLPVARHGRLAMLDGAQLTAMALLWWFLLRSRTAEGRQAAAREGLLAGLAGSALLLLKAPILLPALAAGLLGLALDPARRRGGWLPLLAGLVVGLVPGLGWHLAHAAVRGGDALWLWGGDGVVRVLTDAGEGSDLGWRVPVLEVLEGGWPWLPLWPFALGLAWRERNRAWGRWCLTLQVVLAATILPLRTQLPWYSHPLWLPFALLCGPVLAWLVDPRREPVRPPLAPLLGRIPWLWGALGALLAMLAVGGVIGWLPIGAARDLGMLALPVGVGWLSGGWLLLRPQRRRRLAGAIVMLLGSLLGLLMFFGSPFWLWELNETWAAPPVAALVRRHTSGTVRLWKEEERPSLSWYAGRRITAVGTDRALRKALDRERREGSTASSTWLLARRPPPADRACRVAATLEDWRLWRCSTAVAEKPS
jgi:4-amino-4-deoxy-L-arabinose transferase-like glycosyltransferase